MAKKKKHNFHCQKCNNPCTIYKKGKKHRVLVCPICGILATNPFSLRGAIAGGVGSIPVIGGALEGSGLVESVIGSDKPVREKSESFHVHKSGYPLRMKVLDALR